ncbi:MAG TPA: hypothetical protein VKU03_00270 [Roseiarcus sp.]|nr:hypothetical protein [Roseiarcus sp.]
MSAHLVSKSGAGAAVNLDGLAAAATPSSSRERGNKDGERKTP